MSALGPLAGVGGIGAPTPSAPPVGGAKDGGFGGVLGDQLDKLQALQDDASAQAQALATGKADDIASVALSVEHASLSLQLAAQLRNKLVDAYSEILRMQV